MSKGPAAPKTLVCQCNLSARFVPLYPFTVAGTTPLIVTDRSAMIMCPNCHQVFVWSPPTKAGGDDGGWERSSFLADRETLPD